MKGKITVIQGAQYGSEGKGMITAMESGGVNYKAAVRTGGPNSGHTVFFQGKPYVMNQIPTPWIRPGMKMILGPGAIINPQILEKEISMLEMLGVPIMDRLFIHPNAAVILPEDKSESKESGRYFSLGGTSEGSSSAVTRRIKRDFGKVNTILDYARKTGLKWLVTSLADTTEILEETLDDGYDVIIEGTQGCHLDLALSEYPRTTHRMCNTAALLAEAGLAPTNRVEVGLVSRTYPIRVAGDSGYMPGEISWFSMLDKMGVDSKVIIRFEEKMKEILKRYDAPADTPEIHTWCQKTKTEHRKALRMAYTDALAELDDIELNAVERTSVTQLVRRIATLNLDVLNESYRWSGCTWMALTFTNYVDQQIFNLESYNHSRKLRDWAKPLVNWMEERDVELRWVNTGPLPEQHHVVNRESLKRCMVSAK